MYQICPFVAVFWTYNFEKHDLVGKFKCDFLKTWYHCAFFSNYLDSRHLVFAYSIMIWYQIYLFPQFLFLFFIPNVTFGTQRVPLWGGLVVFEVKFRNLDFYTRHHPRTTLCMNCISIIFQWLPFFWEKDENEITF